VSIALRLTHDEPKLAYLALVYHLGRPGSELDAETKLPSEHGLRPLKVRLGNELEAAEAVIELDDVQYGRLLSAIFGSVNELRVYHLRGGAPSTVAGFEETARSLFPTIASDQEEALTIAEAMMMLHRRIERAVARAIDAAAPAEEPRARKRRWPFGR
jgi:hypothetical protein